VERAVDALNSVEQAFLENRTNLTKSCLKEVSDYEEKDNAGDTSNGSGDYLRCGGAAGVRPAGHAGQAYGQWAPALLDTG
jgi:hypothetical protein